MNLLGPTVTAVPDDIDTSIQETVKDSNHFIAISIILQIQMIKMAFNTYRLHKFIV